MALAPNGSVSSTHTYFAAKSRDFRRKADFQQKKATMKAAVRNTGLMAAQRFLGNE
jgi:hypothetical protein